MGIGTSGYRSNWDYTEVYIIQTDKDGNFTPNTEQPTPVAAAITIVPNLSYTGILTIKAINTPYQTVAVFNTTGQLVFTSDNTSINFDIGNQANGIYFVTLKNKEGKIMHRQKILLQQ
jgi:hypothetical protein